MSLYGTEWRERDNGIWTSAVLTWTSDWIASLSWYVQSILWTFLSFSPLYRLSSIAPLSAFLNTILTISNWHVRSTRNLFIKKTEQGNVIQSTRSYVTALTWSQRNKETLKPSSFISNSTLISVDTKQQQATWITALAGNGNKKNVSSPGTKKTGSHSGEGMQIHSKLYFGTEEHLYWARQINRRR